MILITHIWLCENVKVPTGSSMLQILSLISSLTSLFASLYHNIHAITALHLLVLLSIFVIKRAMKNFSATKIKGLILYQTYSFNMYKDNYGNTIETPLKF